MTKDADDQTLTPPPASGEGEVQPVARVLRITGQYHTGSFCGEFESSAQLSAGTKLYATPPAGAPAAAVQTLTDAVLAKLRDCPLNCEGFGQCKAIVHGMVGKCESPLREPRNPGAAAQVSENKEN